MKRAAAILWYVITLQCDEAERIRCCAGEEPITWWQRLGERLHRMACKSCRRAQRELQALDAAVRNLVHSERGEADAPAAEPPMPDDARDRIAAALRRAKPESHD